jgi:hypothetical protein
MMVVTATAQCGCHADAVLPHRSHCVGIHKVLELVIFLKLGLGDQEIKLVQSGGHNISLCAQQNERWCASAAG